MKKMIIACIITVFTTTGCYIRDGHGWHHHWWHGEVKVTPAAAEARMTPATVATPPTVNAPSLQIVVAAP
jgi:hypothetical protein